MGALGKHKYSTDNLSHAIKEFRRTLSAPGLGRPVSAGAGSEALVTKKKGDHRGLHGPGGGSSVIRDFRTQNVGFGWSGC